MSHPAAVLVCGIIGNIISFLLFFAPATTFVQVYRTRTAVGFSSLPYVVSLFSCALWVFYAVVKTDSHLLLSINAAGCCVEAIYIAFYLAYAPRRKTVRTACSVLLGAAALGLCICVTLEGIAPRHRVKFLGSVCLASSVAVFVAPLGVIVKVVRTRSAEFLPVGLCSCLVLSAVAWFFYGFFTKDPYVMYPNVGGFLLSSIQVALYIWYRYRRPQNNDGAPPPKNDGQPPGAQGQGEITELATAV